MIATYALCGFANLSSIGITLGILGAMAPQRKKEVAEMALRAMISGGVASFMTACIAGRPLDLSTILAKFTSRVSGS